MIRRKVKCWRKIDDDSTRDIRKRERESNIARKAKGPEQQEKQGSGSREEEEAAAKDDLFAPREFGLTKIS